MKVINVVDFTEFPGPRERKFGDFSGEEFRETILIPEIQYGEEFAVCLDNVFGYGSSFLEEAFAGLLRRGVPESVVLSIANNLIAEDDPSLIVEIKQYINEQLERQRSD